ncbi:hypothetical protein HETIRDRAFT_147735 [Heterobasidion irregulare TC 32-1]|uniref:Uncharacterized protein n=1 Tax=Heterobasidion irregulare (strain TC 32-1) TaxID=747525 RepID=W4K7X3_HETIT|nr:uncharacterized protein HETIRDRAFT_147735 [Heterobasidion irregulare TC 32-1]ETW81844.1 hypothetical protein HETIRDRAFT_147735 [Heterobasidion irregulare TC 32-1]
MMAYPCLMVYRSEVTAEGPTRHIVEILSILKPKRTSKSITPGHRRAIELWCFRSQHRHSRCPHPFIPFPMICSLLYS